MAKWPACLKSPSMEHQTLKIQCHQYCTENCVFIRYNRSVAQLMIRWSVQKGYVTIPMSSKTERVLENTKVFDWTISSQDMEVLVSVPGFIPKLVTAENVW